MSPTLHQIPEEHTFSGLSNTMSFIQSPPALTTPMNSLATISVSDLASYKTKTEED